MKGPRIVKKKAINSESDPYLNVLSPDEMGVCKKCGSVYHDKRWYHRDDIPAKLAGKKTSEVLCAACRKIKDKFAEGYVTLEGDFVKKHREEIINLVKNKETQASHLNPLERIIEIAEKNGGMEITTTTEKLAQMIGRMLNKSYDGEVEYKWSSDVKLARVVWVR